MNPDINIEQAKLSDLDDFATMFDEYRQFYAQTSDVERCRTFLSARLAKEQSIAFIAKYQGHAAGFIHLYPSFSSVSLSSIWVLNDLWVRPKARKTGVGKALMERAKDLAIMTGAKYLQLATAKDNLGAQHLYESLGYIQDQSYFHYTLNTYHSD